MILMKEQTSKNRFTIMEILVILLILIVLASMGLGIYQFAIRQANEAQTKSLIQQLEVALVSYQAKYGYYLQQPNNYSGLLILSDGEFKKFIDYERIYKNNMNVSSEIIDCYGRSLKYMCPGKFNRTTFDLGSVGSDGIYGSSGSIEDFGKGDDIVNFR